LHRLHRLHRLVKEVGVWLFDTTLLPYDL